MLLESEPALDILNDILQKNKQTSGVDNLIELFVEKTIDKNNKIFVEDKKFIKDNIFYLDKSDRIIHFIKFYNILNVIKNTKTIEIFFLSNKKIEQKVKRKVISKINEIEGDKKHVWGKNKDLYLFDNMVKNQNFIKKIKKIIHFLKENKIIESKTIFIK